MKQAIYIFSIYIGVVTFYTLSYFRQTMEISLSASITGNADHRRGHFRG